MFRNKYKYSKNHGLLPSVAHKPYRSPVTSIAILANDNPEREYTLRLHPNNPGMLVMFNDREYLHKECTALVSG
jgi:hypothetical protein